MYRTLPHSVNTLHAIIWIYELFSNHKEFSIKCVLNYHWSRLLATEWVVILPLFRLSICLILVFYLYSVFFFIVYLVIFMYAHQNRNGCAALLYLYRSLYYFRTQILLHFYMYIVWHSKAFGNNTNGLRLCVSVVVGWLVVFYSVASFDFLSLSFKMNGRIDNKCVELRTMHSLFNTSQCVYQLGRSIENTMTITTATTLKLLFAPSWFKRASLSLSPSLSFTVCVCL